MQYNTCDTLSLVYSAFGNGIVHEYADHIDFYLNNYRTDTTTQVTDRITVTGVLSEPKYSMRLRAGAKGTASASWDSEMGSYTVSVKHMGPVELTVSCSGGASERRTDVLDLNALTDLPAQPEEYYGDLIIEAEDMDYKNISSCCTNPYYSNPSVRGHAANGFVITGGNASGSLRRTVNIKHPGVYTVSVRYMNSNAAGKLTLKVNSSSKLLNTSKTAFNDWKTVQYDYNMNAGSNTITITNTGGTNMYIDQVVCSPQDKHTLVYDQASDSVYADGKHLRLEAGDYKMLCRVSGVSQYRVCISDTLGNVVCVSPDFFTAMGNKPDRFLFSVDKENEYVIHFNSAVKNLFIPHAVHVFKYGDVICSVSAYSYTLAALSRIKHNAGIKPCILVTVHIPSAKPVTIDLSCG